MKKLLSEIITAWWSEVDTKLVNPKSDEAIKGLKLVLREDFGFDSDVIDYVVEMIRSTPTNFDLGGKTSGIDVGKNQTAVSAQLHPVWDDDEEEDDEDDVYNNNDGELSEWDVTLLDGLDELNEDTWVKNQKGNIYTVKNFDPETHTKLTDDEIEAYKKSQKAKGEPIEDDPSGEEESGEEETQQQQPDNGKPEFSDSDKVAMMTQTERDAIAKKKAAEKDNMSIESEVDRSKFDEKEKEHKDNPNGPNRNEILDDLNNGNLDVLSEYQNGVAQNREKGIAGAGGPVASEGESKYCSAVDTDWDKWDSENKDEIDTMVSKFVDNTKSADEKRTAEHLGLDPDSDEFNTYLAKREVWSNQQLDKLKADKDSVFYKNFKGDEDAYKEWMKAAYDGGRTTQQALKESSIDTTKPHKTIQSTPEVDQAVEAHLEDTVKNSKSPEDKKHAETQLKNFRKFKSYHDTYVIGKDENDRITYMGISNKKDDQLRDPQNNSTPKKRFESLEKSYGKDVAEAVTNSLNKNIDRVSNVQQNTVKAASNMEVTDDFVSVCETTEMKKYMDILRNRKDMKKYLTDKGVDITKLSNKELLVEMNNKAKEMIESGNTVPYSPYGKITIKVGELSKVSKFRKKYPNINFNDSSIKGSIDIKQKEQNVVTDSHKSLVSDLVNADKPDGYSEDNPDADNGKHQQGYISSVLDACHIDTYIDMDSDDGMLLQMGINGVKPSMIRDCVAERSGFKGDTSTPDGKKALKDHLRKRCRVTPGESSVKIMDNGKEVDLFEDTWRTAGTSQKVATHFGGDMRNCLQNKAAK